MFISCIVPSCQDEPKENKNSDSDALATVISADGIPSTPGSVFSKIDETTFMLDYVKYKIVDSHLEIIGYDEIELAGEPKLYAQVTIDGVSFQTRKIDEFAFSWAANLKRIVIPNTVKEIGKYCFAKCWSLEYIKLPEGISELRNCTFYGCSSLESIILPKSINKIGHLCFGHCPKGMSIYFQSEIPPSLITENSALSWSPDKRLGVSHDIVDDTYYYFIAYVPEESFDSAYYYAFFNDVVFYSSLPVE